MKYRLEDICSFRKEKVAVSSLTLGNYISTENMLPNKAGITKATSLPKCNTTQRFECGDVLVSNIRPYFKKIWKAKFNGGSSNDVLVFTAKEGFDSEFLYYVLLDDSFFDYSMVTSKGTKMPRGDKKSIMNYEVPCFDINIQIKIASILKSIDEKIEKNNAINNNLEQQAVLLFKKWFIEFDNTSKNILETRFGLIPESFKLLKNGELPLVVTDYVANGSFASLKANVTLYQEPNYAYFIRNTDLKSGTFGVFVDEHSYNFLSKSTLYGGEIIISNVGDVGSVFLCPKLDKPMTLGNNIIMLRPEQENLQYYLYIWFKWLYGQSLIQEIKGGSAQPKFNKTDFKNLPIFLPPDDLLEQFHQIVKPMFELIDENNAEKKALTITRDTLLPRLMSGELDVSDIDL
jgi:type I restriction enzyme S subunit